MITVTKDKSSEKPSWSATLGAEGRQWLFSRAAMTALSPFCASLPISLEGVIGHVVDAGLPQEGAHQLDYFGLGLVITVCGQKVFIDASRSVSYDSVLRP